MDDTRTRRKPHIRRKILIPLALVVVGIICLFGILGMSALETNIEHKIDHELEEVEGLYLRLSNSEARAMESQLGLLSINTDLLAAWKAKDMDLLLERAKPLFKSLTTTDQITHMYFVDVDRTCLLRVHAPERRGDVISRFTMLEAESKERTSSGIELGPLGTFTLRTVMPWIVDGELVGYIELGEEIGHLTPQLRWISELEVIFTVDKNKLTRASWEAGSKFFGRSNEWETYEDFVIMDKTYSALPDRIADFLTEANAVQNARKTIAINGQTYRLAGSPLKDTAGNTVGRMVIVLDVTAILRNFHQALITGVSVAFLAAGILLLSFYVYTGKIDREMLSYRMNLEKEVEARSSELMAIRKEVKELTGFIPICSYCKKIRDDQGYWKMLELYISEHSEATFDHCICETCLKKNFPDIDEMRSVTDELNNISDESPDTDDTPSPKDN